MGATVHMLPDGKRLHLNHGPIDVIIEAWGEASQVQQAFAAAKLRFATILEELVSELPVLRTEVPEAGLELCGRVARRMEQVVRPHWASRLTPMAAVAGAVADEILQCMLGQSKLRRAYVNNGGDIALHVELYESFVIACAGGQIIVTGADWIGGIATSGWRGRSFSLGIADSVTILAATAAQADVAATMVANAVDLPGSAKVHRQPACQLSPDSDLGDRLVTVNVSPLNVRERDNALCNGVVAAHTFLQNGDIAAASLTLSGKTLTVGHRCNPFLTKEPLYA